MGRKKLPENVKKIKGTQRKDREIENHPDPPELDALPEPPNHLNERAIKIWNEYGQQLTRLGVLRPTDIELFAAFCCEVAVYRKCTGVLNKDGEWIEEKYSDGTIKSMKRHPAAMIKSKALTQIKGIASLFGLDPHSRQNIKVEKKGKDPLEEHLNKKIG